MKAPPRYLVDTGVLIRFLSGEPPAQAAAAKSLFARTAAGKAVLDVSPVIVAETLHTLLSLYGVNRQLAAGKLSDLLRQRGIKLRDASQVLSALGRLQFTEVGFADAFLAACAAEETVPVASFDKDFGKFDDVTPYQPEA